VSATLPGGWDAIVLTTVALAALVVLVLPTLHDTKADG
jgi:hypothetical protein